MRRERANSPNPLNRDLSNFQIMEELGSGSYGTAYKVRDLITSEIMVMKQVKLNSDDPNELNMKLSECNVIKNLRHPNVCRFKLFFV